MGAGCAVAAVIGYVQQHRKGEFSIGMYCCCNRYCWCASSGSSTAVPVPYAADVKNLTMMNLRQTLGEKIRMLSLLY